MEPESWDGDASAITWFAPWFCCEPTVHVTCSEPLVTITVAQLALPHASYALQGRDSQAPACLPTY